MSRTLTRLDLLERQQRAQVARVEAVKEQQWAQAVGQLTQAECDALSSWIELETQDPARLAQLEQLLRQCDGPPLPGGEAGRHWHEALRAAPDGVPYPAAPTGAAVYFGAEAQRAQQVTCCRVLSPDLHLGAAWTAAYWRWLAALAGVIGEGE